MMKFLANHDCELKSDPNSKRSFSGWLAPLLVSLMQFFGAVFTEAINIVSICSLGNTKDVIMNFIALGIIAQIDDLYLSALPASALKCRLDEPFEVKKKSGEIYFWDRDW
jgi:hypothetical protein